MERQPKRAKEALTAVAEMKSQITRLTRRIQVLEAKCTNITTHYGGKSSTLSHNELWDILSDERVRLGEQLRRVMAVERQISEWIDLLPRERWRMVLRLRYLDGMSVPEVAEEMSRAFRRPYSHTQIYRFQKDALEAAERLWFPDP